MKKKEWFFIKIIYGLYFLATVFSFFIVYQNIENTISFSLLVGYLAFTFFLLIVLMTRFVKNIWKLKRYEVKMIIVKFIRTFLFLIVLNLMIGYIMRPGKLNLLSIFSTNFGLAFGLSSFDVLFFQKKDHAVQKDQQKPVDISKGKH